MRFDRFLHFFHGNAVILNLPGLHQVVQRAEGFRHVVDLGRRAVQLHQVQGLDVQIFQAALDKRSQVLRSYSPRRRAD